MKSNEASPFKLVRYALSSRTVQDGEGEENPRKQLAEKTKPTNEIYKKKMQNKTENRKGCYLTNLPLWKLFSDGQDREKKWKEVTETKKNLKKFKKQRDLSD